MANRRSIYDFVLQIGAQLSSSFNRVLNQAGDRAERVGHRLESAFDGACGKAIKNLSSVEAAIGGLAAGMAVAMDGENRKLQAQLGATAEEMQGIKAASAAVFKTGMIDDITEANNVMLELSRTMEGLSDADKATIGAQVATLNMTYDMDTAEVTRAADTMMKNFGVSAGEAMDYIGWGMQNNLDFSDEFLDTLNEYGPQFRDAGFSANEMFAILKAGTEGGAWNLDKVGDTAKEFGLRIKDGSKSTNEAMAELSAGTQAVFRDMLAGGASTTDVMNSVIGELSQMDDQVKAFQIAQGLFGTMSEDLTLDVLYNLQNIGAETVNVTGTVGQMADTLQGGVGLQLKGALNTSKLALADLGQEILTVAMPAIQTLVGGVIKASEWFINLDGSTKRTIVLVGGVAAAIGPAMVAVNSIGKAITMVGGAIRGVTTLARGAGMIIGFLSSPVGIAVVALAALAAGLYYVGTHINEIKEGFSEFGAKVGAVIDGVKATVIGGISSAVETAKSLLSNLGAIAGGVIKMPINAGINVVNGAISGINQLAIDVPSWVPGIGGKHLGFNIPTIPALATGGIAVAPTLAMIGEGKESEAILPLSKLKTLLKEARGPENNKSTPSSSAIAPPSVIVHNKAEKPKPAVMARLINKLSIGGESSAQGRNDADLKPLIGALKGRSIGDKANPLKAVVSHGEENAQATQGKAAKVSAPGQLLKQMPVIAAVKSPEEGQSRLFAQNRPFTQSRPFAYPAAVHSDSSAIERQIQTVQSTQEKGIFYESVQTPTETAASEERVTLNFNVVLNGGATEQQAMDLAMIVKREIEKYEREKRRLSLARVN